MIVNLNGEYVKIDDQIVASIIELNRKGYKTRNCCSGHDDKKYISGYIQFYKKYEFISIPRGWELDNFEGINYEYNNHITIRFDLEDCFNKEVKIKRAMNSLWKWAIELPELKRRKGER